MDNPDYRQKQWEEEYQQWLEDLIAQKEYKEWLDEMEKQSQDEERRAW